MRLTTIICRHWGFLLLGALALWAPAHLAGAAETITTHSASTVRPVAGLPEISNKNATSSQPAPPLTHQIQSAGQTTAPCSALRSATPLTLPSGTVGRPYTATITASGGFPPVSYALTKGAVLPPGLQLTSRGIISGTPVEAGPYRFGILAYDRCPAGVQSRENVFNLTILNALPAAQPNHNATLHRPIPDHRQATFALEGVHLFFENRGASIVVAQNAILPGLIAQVRLRGEGVVRGYWQVDTGRRHLFTQRLQGPVASIAFPEKAQLPTTEPGRHDVRLVITNANTAMPESLASYRVIAGSMALDDSTHRQIMVTVMPTKGPRIIDRLCKQFALRQVESFDVRVLGFRTYVLESDGDIQDLVASIRRDPDVLQADPNQIYRTFSDPKRGFQQIAGRFNFEGLHARSRGRGVLVAVIDTGVDATHRDLETRVQVSENMVADSPFQPEIHGTAVAGIIGAAINGFGIEGIAPEAELLALRACRQVSPNHPGGRGDTVALVKALDRALVKQAKVVNMSFGALRPDGLVEMLLEKGAADGVLFVAPVGNERGMKTAWFPASSPWVVAVGGRDAKGRPYPDAHADSFTRVCAPAENIFTTIPHGRFNFLTGTSMSSAIVAGMLALAAERSPDLKLEDLPPFEGSTCRWLEHLMDVPICAAD